MATTIQEDMPPIARGYAYAFRLQVAAQGEVIFPAGSQFRAEVRSYAGAPVLAGEITTQSGGMVRVDGVSIDITLPGAITAKLDRKTAAIDLVRTDVSPEAYIGIGVLFTVEQPVTIAKAGT